MISLMAARLFVHTFERGDFTGWPEIGDYQGVRQTMLEMTADGGPHRWSVIAQNIEDEKWVYTLVVTDVQMNASFKFLIKAVALHETKDSMRLGITLYFGENLVLDCVDKPVYKPQCVPVQDNDSETEDEELPEEEPVSRRERRRRNRQSTRDAKGNAPPRPRMSFRRGM